MLWVPDNVRRQQSRFKRYTSRGPGFNCLDHFLLKSQRWRIGYPEHFWSTINELAFRQSKCSFNFLPNKPSNEQKFCLVYLRHLSTKVVDTITMYFDALELCSHFVTIRNTLISIGDTITAIRVGIGVKI